MKNGDKCKYSVNYAEYLGESKKFVCEENAIQDGYCMFHHPTFWEKNQSMIEKNIHNKIFRMIKENKDMYCIGYNLTKINIENLVIKNKVIFQKGKFHDEITFSNVTFNSLADFSGSSFLDDVNFISCVYKNYALYSWSEFFKAANFQQSIFHSRTLFTNTTFTKEATFFNVVFKNESVFIDVKFKDLADFNTAFFLSSAYFHDIEFEGFTHFSDTSFSERVDFDGSTFSDVSFNGSIFFSNVNFSYCDFKNKATFNNIEVYSGFPLADLKLDKYVNFQYVMIHKPEYVSFNNINMNKISFKGTDISRVNLNNIIWEVYQTGFSFYDHKIFLFNMDTDYIEKYVSRIIYKYKKYKFMDDEKIRKMIQIKYDLFDNEKDIDKIMKVVNDEFIQEINREEKYWVDYLKSFTNEYKLSLDDLLTIYRGFRENHDYYLKYEDSGKFFVEEMELLRLTKNKFESTVFWLYKTLSNYGESFSQPLLYSIGIIIGCTFGYFIRGILMNPYSKLTLSFLSTTIFEGITFSLGTFFQIHQEFNFPSIIMRLISIPLLGSLYISLKRKLERRMRH